MSAKRRRKPPNASWVTYERCYLVTLGLAVLVIMSYVWFKQGGTFTQWPLEHHLIFFGMLAFGITLIGVGLLADRKKIEWYANATSAQDGGFIIMIVAFPVYLVMSWIASLDEKS